MIVMNETMHTEACLREQYGLQRQSSMAALSHINGS